MYIIMLQSGAKVSIAGCCVRKSLIPSRIHRKGAFIILSSASSSGSIRHSGRVVRRHPIMLAFAQ